MRQQSAAFAAIGAGEVEDGGAAAVVDEPEGVRRSGRGREAAGFGDRGGLEGSAGFDAGEGGWLFLFLGVEDCRAQAEKY